MLSQTFPNNGKNPQHFPSLGITKIFLCNRDSTKEARKTSILFQMEEDISPTSVNVTGESSLKFKQVENAYACFVESDERNEGHKITKCLRTR